MIKRSWDLVKTSTISNCWHHCGFLDNYTPIADNDLTIRLKTIDAKLKDIDNFALSNSSDCSNHEAIESFSADELIQIDENECIQSLTDEDILLIVKNEEKREVIEEADDTNNIPPKIISFDEVRHSFDTILSFFNNRAFDEKEMREVKNFKNFLETIFIDNNDIYD